MIFWGGQVTEIFLRIVFFVFVVPGLVLGIQACGEVELFGRVELVLGIARRRRRGRSHFAPLVETLKNLGSIFQRIG